MCNIAYSYISVANKSMTKYITCIKNYSSKASKTASRKGFGDFYA